MVNLIRLGFHLSIAGAISNAAIEAISNDYKAFQIFTTSSRSWKNSEIDGQDCKNFARYTKQHDMMAYAHIPYLCNPASINRDVYEKSRQMLVDNISNCETLGVGYLVIHLGSHLGKGMPAGIKNVCDALSYALAKTDRATVLLENGAGYKNCVGSKFDEIGKIIDTVGSDRVGVCLDTCHAFAAGYDLRSPDAVESSMEEFDSSIGASRLKLVHLNDAKHELGSGLDRHWHIGRGYIGREGFTSIFSHKNFRSGSFVMELPEDEQGDHSDDMNAVVSILDGLGR